AFGYTPLHASDLHRLGQQVAVVGNLEEWERGTQIIGIGQEELHPARWSGIGPTQAVPAGRHLKKWLNLAIDHELITQDSVSIEQIKEEKPGVGIEYFVGDYHGHIELAAGQAKTGSLVPGIKLVEQQELPDQSFVDVLSSKVDAVIMIEQGAERLADIAIGGRKLRIGDPRQDVGIMMVIKLT